jgi:hypothetical protein
MCTYLLMNHVRRYFSHHHPFISELHEDTNSGYIHVKPFYQFDNRVVAHMRPYLKKRRMKRSTKADIVRSAGILYQGWIYGNTLYYKNGMKACDIVETILHEYVHWRRKCEGLYKYCTANDKFIEECFANIVSQYWIDLYATRVLLSGSFMKRPKYIPIHVLMSM